MKKFHVSRRVTFIVITEVEAETEREAAEKSFEIDPGEFQIKHPEGMSVQYDEGARDEYEVCRVREDGRVFDYGLYFQDHMSDDKLLFDENRESNVVRVSANGMEVNDYGSPTGRIIPEGRLDCSSPNYSTLPPPACSGPPMEETDDGCDGKKWLHMEDPFEIQRCDECAEDGVDDVDAAVAHAAECGCDWPPYDYQDGVRRRFCYTDSELPSRILPLEDYTLFLDLKDEVDVRENFKENLPKLIDGTNDVITRFKKYSVPTDSLENALEILREAEEKVAKGEWRPWWTGSREDGFMEKTATGEKWYARKEEK